MSTFDEAKNNYLLTTLPAYEFASVRQALERVSLTTGQVLHQSGYDFDYVYFPTTALITLLYLTESGTSVGVGMIGREGVLGIEIFMHADTALSLAIVQNGGIAYRMKTDAFRAKCAAAPACQATMLRYTQALFDQVSQAAVCNRFHTVQQRFARWLLESSDRLGANRLTITHEQIAGSLGVQRSSISIAAHNLSSSGIIKVERGSVTILDRPGLELAACECYKVVSDDYYRLLGQRIPREHSDKPSQPCNSDIPESATFTTNL